MQPKPPTCLLAALAIAAIAAGCGGGSSNGSAATEGSNESTASNGSAGAGAGNPIATSTLTKAEYVKRANAVCTRDREERIKALNAYREKHPEDGQEENFAGSFQVVYAPMMREELAQLRELGAPKGDEDHIEEMIASFEKWVGEAEDLNGAKPTPEFNKEVIRAGNLAGYYGLLECTYG